MKKLIMWFMALTCAVILSGCGNPSIDVVNEFYSALRADDFKKAEGFMTPATSEQLRGNRNIKKIIAAIRMSKDAVATEVVKESEREGVKKSVVRATCNSTTLYFVVITNGNEYKISDIAEDAYHVSL